MKENNLGEIKVFKKVDETFRGELSSRVFKYLNYQNDRDKEKLKSKFLDEGYTTIFFNEKTYDFFNLELINDGNYNIEHNVESQIQKIKLDYTLLNCALNLSLASKNSNLKKTSKLDILRKKDIPTCNGICENCSLNREISEFSDEYNIMFPSLYFSGDLYIDNDLNIVPKEKSKKMKNHIDIFEVNSNKKMYKELECNLEVLDQNINHLPSMLINLPRYYLTVLILEYIKKSKNQIFTVKRLLRTVKNKISTLESDVFEEEKEYRNNFEEIICFLKNEFKKEDSSLDIYNEKIMMLIAKNEVIGLRDLNIILPLELRGASYYEGEVIIENETSKFLKFCTNKILNPQKIYDILKKYNSWYCNVIPAIYIEELENKMCYLIPNNSGKWIKIISKVHKKYNHEFLEY